MQTLLVRTTQAGQVPADVPDPRAWVHAKPPAAGDKSEPGLHVHGTLMLAGARRHDVYDPGPEHHWHLQLGFLCPHILPAGCKGPSALLSRLHEVKLLASLLPGCKCSWHDHLPEPDLVLAS